MAVRKHSTKVHDLHMTEHSSSTSEPSRKKSRNGIVLVPQPSDDPRDPLVCPRLDTEIQIIPSDDVHRIELASVQEVFYFWDIEPRCIRRACLLIGQSIGICCASQAVTQDAD